ncbi:MAG TPA: fumarylacetoacetate hydrolase family protein [Stellaceae bacterium]|jgi:2-keto-4-pentenoate hydratase/2-oxohepta-3-ene-1,7-dioic acid hydratase in catechol pathway|nr:fumarylacetoacetate hydrolase family protein [Stellaceae bacterium]
MTPYKLLTFRGIEGVRPGIAVGETIWPLRALPSLADYASLLDVLEDWATAEPLLQLTADRLPKDAMQDAALPLVGTELLPPVPRPSAIYCAGANYMDHVKEMAAAKGLNSTPDPRAGGQLPWHFIKATGTLAAPGAAIAVPKHTKKLDWEIELTAVIGRPAKDVSVADALHHVAGYTIANDLSARDHSVRESVPIGSGFRNDWLSQKSFDGSCPIGPWIVPARFIADPQNLAMKLWVNGVIKQDSSSNAMIFTLAEQIAYLSSRMTLHPGDLILTGTPAGVGNARREFLQPGDVVKVWIDGIGSFENQMV